MKKKFFTSIAVTFVMAAALVAVAPTNAQAAKAINVKVGEKTTVKASKKVTWSIKDTSIATLNKKSGKKVKLTGVKEGSTILTTTDASGKKLDYAVNVKAAAAAPAATNKLQEFANYIKSKNGITYKGSVEAWNNYEILNNKSYGWEFGNKAKLDDGKDYQVVYRYGVKEGDHKASDVYYITADANNVYFKLVRQFDELDVRYVNTVNDHKATDPTSIPSSANKGKGLKDWDGNLVTDLRMYNPDRYYIYGTLRNNDQFTVTIPLNGNAATATFAHNTYYDFFKGDSYTFDNGKSTVGAIYSEWNYQFAIGAYLTNAAYSWTVSKDGHDYLGESVKDVKYTNKIGSLGKSELTQNLANVSVLLSYQLNNLLNTIDSILKDNATGYDLKCIGFTNFTNGNGHYFTNADKAIAALYTVAWENIAFY